MTKVAVLGGGMVGVCCALALQRSGVNVTLIDRRPPGRETSYGNAGVVARSSLMPLNNPGLWKTLPKMLSNRTASLRYNIPFLLRNMGWVIGFLANARAKPFSETTAALDALIRCSDTEHLRLLDEAGATGRLTDKGWIFLYRSGAGYDGAALGRETFDHFGLETETIDKAGLNDLEPSLKPVFEKALWIKSAHSIDNPGGLVEDYARLFASRGGIICETPLQKLEQEGSRWTVVEEDGTRSVWDKVVVALGPWSKQFLGRMGIKVPMGFERGYHMHYESVGNARLGRPIYDTARGYVLSPMAQGLRLTTGVELNDCDAPANPAQLRMAVTSAREAFPVGEALEETPWLGRRPTLPDSRPIIGEAPERRGLWLAFGHQHIGFSTGPGTARLLTELMTGAKTVIDPHPFRAARFIR